MASKFFRKPTDVSDDTSTSTEASASVSEVGQQQSTSAGGPSGLKVVRRAVGTSRGRRVASPLRRVFDPTDAASPTEDVGGPAKTHPHEKMFMHSLMFDKCTQLALDYYNQQGARQYTKEDPEVKALANAKYQHMSATLEKHGYIEPGGNVDHLHDLRAAHLEGIDYLAKYGPVPEGQPALEEKQNTSIKLHKRLGTPPRGFLPPVLQPLVENHPIYQSSHYTRNFTEVRLLGKGGYGKVYESIHKLDKKNYAIKKIPLSPSLIQKIEECGESYLDALLIEVNTLARLEHPKIVRYHQSWLEPTRSIDLQLNKTDRQLLEGGGLESLSLGADSESIIVADESLQQSHTRSEKSSILFEGEEQSPAMHQTTGLDVVFEEDEGDVQGKPAQPPTTTLIKAKRPLKSAAGVRGRRRSSTSSATTTGTSKPLPSQHGSDFGDDVEVVPRRSTSSNLASNLLDDAAALAFQQDHAPAQMLTLYIQMTLYPLTLAEYLSPAPPSASSTTAPQPSHCFHLRPSLSILLALIDGVQYLHQQGIIHRDIKPANIFLSFHGAATAPSDSISCCCPADSRLSVRIGDFGLVTDVARPDSGAAELLTKAVGTEFYRPPADPKGKGKAEKLGTGLDVYALGVVAVELLCKFGTKMERAMALKGLKEGVLPAELEEGVVDVVKGMVRGDEKERFGCQEVKYRVKGLLEAMG